MRRPRSRFRQKPLAQKLEDNKRALQGWANLAGKAVLDPGKRDPFDSTPRPLPASKQARPGSGNSAEGGAGVGNLFGGCNCDE